MFGMRVLGCGGRDYGDYPFVQETLDRFEITEVAHGAAPGTDSLVGRWGIHRRLKTIAYPADWDKYGKRAGPLRNLWMLADFQPELVVAFPGGVGTAHMVQIARAAEVDVFVATPESIIALFPS